MTDQSTAQQSTKIGTEVFGVRVVSGSIPHAEPDAVILRQLYPGTPTDIGVIDSIGDGTGQTTIYPSHRRDWTERDRIHLAEFFAARYAERCTGTFATAPTALEPTDDRAA